MGDDRTQIILHIKLVTLKWTWYEP